MKTLKVTLSRQLRQHHTLLLLALFSIGLLLVRAKLANSIFYFFLAWNLFLAYTPLGLTTLLKNNIPLIDRRLYFYPAFFCWLMLLPNAPYIITDFVHLQKETNIPVWYDVLLLISFTASGLLFGLASMKDMHSIVTARSGSRRAWLVTGVTCLLCGFGIYVGRFLRYNSWDILHKPLVLCADILHSLTAAATCKPAWGITLGFGTLLFLLFRLYHTNSNQ